MANVVGQLEGEGCVPPRRTPMLSRGKNGLWSLILSLVGWVLLVVGVVMTPLPPPFAFGLPLAVVGLILVLGNSHWARRRFVWLRRRYPRLLDPVRKLLKRRMAWWPFGRKDENQGAK